ncbi:ABC transporter ATP-binding protein [Tumebacillus permanentifrigoris]|uniref:ABC-2 type transport system ATP-binding protein n=1 Tax=Tumebacillus permanentifrigoris TaxID=378543 RepID=A0A316DPB2_9BACL|nr:ABC transporter ATP-binding protein [Tumebacillus permanentifrigoris]PWK03934.1 ABC-2 type transport system ATP-binding protein [Tumebacillus permanentifrigoris]
MLQVQDLRKRFGQREVVRGVSFEVGAGESFGLLGPNGAGKSTIISMICGLVTSDRGDVRVGGESVKQNPLVVKQKIGVVPQDIALYPTMSARENLLFWARMYGMKGAEVKRRADEVLEIIGLSDRAKEPIGTFSGGMKRRTNIGAALMHHPQLLIMDEPTVGIDPQSRNYILETVKRLNEDGMTVLYTSHYMEEVEYLCNRVAIVDHGELIALGTKQELYRRLNGGACVQVLVEGMQVEQLPMIEQLPGVTKAVLEGEMLTVFAQDVRQVLGDVMTSVLALGALVRSVDVREPSLETVFMQLTGRTLRD